MDDERHIVDFVTMGLEGRGMAVRGATDGPAALKDLEEFQPDVVVLDLMLRGSPGSRFAGGRGRGATSRS